tara:strand:- start:6196 stop:7458 length:1263 start_codon:yes stop_codon:yes gene_type:complete
MTVVTSKPSPVVIGQARNKETIYTATKTTKLADGTYKVEMLQYSDAKGEDGKVIATRDSVNEWTFNDNASGKVKQNESRLNNASKNQMESMRGQFVKKSQDAKEYNKAQGQPNKANTPPETGDNSNPSLEQTKKSKPARNKFGKNIVYPLGLGNSKQDIIMFSMLKYEPKNITSSSGQFGFGDRDSNRTPIGSVVLPIPSNIQDTNSVQWGSSTMNPLEIAAGIAALKAISGDMEGVKGTVKNTLGAVQGNKGEIKTAIAGLMAGAAIGKGSDLLSRTVGAVINPNMELLFKGPQLRPFTFSFKLSPRSKKEAENVIRIIRFFKQGMSPIKSNSNLFLKSPHTFKIQYKLRGADGEDHPYIGKIKECGLQSCNVQYTPEGSYATYYDGTMASYQMSLTFSELEPVFNNDYEDDNDQSLGF